MVGCCRGQRSRHNSSSRLFPPTAFYLCCCHHSGRKCVSNLSVIGDWQVWRCACEKEKEREAGSCEQNDWQVGVSKEHHWVVTLVERWMSIAGYLLSCSLLQCGRPTVYKYWINMCLFNYHFMSFTLKGGVSEIWMTFFFLKQTSIEHWELAPPFQFSSKTLYWSRKGNFLSSLLTNKNDPITNSPEPPRRPLPVKLAT